ncbi:acyl-CoA dehydrogenase family protein [Sphingomonas sp.]|uniref:acyl-CoA dehydrogenase family protein n=1 Tax=Sphingomonas sp. TaxID=28214 RepID=UPI003D6D0CC4
MTKARMTDSPAEAVTPAAYAARVQTMATRLPEWIDRAEEDRQLPPEFFAACTQAGLFKVFQPRRWGGFELPPLSFFDAIYELSRVYPSAGWVYGVIGPHSWEVAALSHQAQADVWGEDPDAVISSSFAPMGKVIPVDGGYRLDGTWKYSSGSTGCSWVLVGGAVTRPGGPPDIRNFLLPLSDYAIVDTWQTMGLKGTGSNDIVIRDAFVPDYRSNSLEDLYYGNNPGRRENDGPLYKLPFMALFAPLLAYAAMGAAIGAHTLLTRYIADGAGTLNKGYDLAEEGHTHLRLARAVSDIEASRALLDALIGRMYAHALADEEIPLLLRKRIRFEASHAVERAYVAVMDIFRAAGTSVIAAGHPIQRHVLDVMTARTHIANNLDRIATFYGRELLGIAGPPKGPGDFTT